MKVFLAVLATMIAVAAFAVVPPTMTYQGIFMDAEGNVMPDGDYVVGFHIFGGPGGGPPDWTEYDTIHVENGLFEVVLGQSVPMNPAFIRPTGTWLGLTYNQQFLEPRQPMNTVAYSFRTCWADSAFGAATLGIHTPESITAFQDSTREKLNCFGAFSENAEGGIVGDEADVTFESSLFTVNCQSSMIYFAQLINDGMEHDAWKVELFLVQSDGTVYSETAYQVRATEGTDMHIQRVDVSVEPGDYFLRVEVRAINGEVDLDDIEFGAMWQPSNVVPTR